MSPPEAEAGSQPTAVIFGCAGPRLSAEERRFFRDADPLGFILFGRNCETADQIQALTTALRDSVGRSEAPVLIDQEGGRVARLRPPLGHDIPSARRIGDLHARDADAGRASAWLAGRLIADDLTALGIDVDCAPVLDLARPETTKAIGDRAFSGQPQTVIELGRAVAEGLMAGGVLPVLKHMPGHGRATVDSHEELPTVTATQNELVNNDFQPFRALADLPLGMTAHVRYTALDEAQPATLSATVIAAIVRDEIGFDGLLMTDDLAMQALDGKPAERAAGALRAGCDLALHCTGEIAEMRDVIAAVPPLSSEAGRRWRNARAAKPLWNHETLVQLLPMCVADTAMVDAVLADDFAASASALSDILMTI